MESLGADSGTESGGRVVGKGEDQGLQEQTGLVLFHVQKGRQVVVAEVNGQAHLLHVSKKTGQRLKKTLAFTKYTEN